LAPLRGAIWVRAARAKYLYQYRNVANVPFQKEIKDMYSNMYIGILP
jgi:hypothetical protein